MRRKGENATRQKPRHSGAAREAELMVALDEPAVEMTDQVCQQLKRRVRRRRAKQGRKGRGQGS